MNSKAISRVVLALLLLVLLGGGIWFVRRVPNLSPTTQQLFLGLKSSDMQTISAAIQQGADVNAHDEFGFTPLMQAVMYGASDAVPLLLDTGADINARTSGNETALMIAVKFKQEGTIHVLLDHKADINVRAVDGQTALTLARGYRLPLVAARLEKLGAVK